MPVTAGSSVGGHPTQQMARPQVQHQNDQMTRIAAPAPDWTQRAAGAAVAPKRLRPIFYAEHMSRKQVPSNLSRPGCVYDTFTAQTVLSHAAELENQRMSFLIPENFFSVFLS